MEKYVEAYMDDCLGAYEKSWEWQARRHAFDLCGLGDGIRLNIALAWLRQGLEQIPAARRLDSKREEVSALLSAFFDIVFGEGTAADMDCGTDTDSWVEAYLDFMAFVGRQNDALVRFREYAERRYVEKALASVSAEGIPL